MKWLGKIISPKASRESDLHAISRSEKFVLGSLAALTILACVSFNFLTEYFLAPFVGQLSLFVNQNFAASLGGGQFVADFINQNWLILVVMVGIIFLLPTSIFLFAKQPEKNLPYLAGRNSRKNPAAYVDTFGKERDISLKNYYFGSKINEGRWLLWGGVASVVFILASFLGSVAGYLK
jgi:hypothetical protein